MKVLEQLHGDHNFYEQKINISEDYFSLFQWHMIFQRSTLTYLQIENIVPKHHIQFGSPDQSNLACGGNVNFRMVLPYKDQVTLNLSGMDGKIIGSHINIVCLV